MTSSGIYLHKHEQDTSQEEDDAAKRAGEVGNGDEDGGHEQHVAIVHQVPPGLELGPSQHHPTS